MTSTRLTRTRRRAAAFALALAAVAGTAGSSAAVGTTEPEGDVAPPRGAVDAAAPSVALAATVTEIDRIALDARGADLAAAAAALRQAQAAFAGTAEDMVPTHLFAAADALVGVQRELAARLSGPAGAELGRLAVRLDGVARRIATDVLARATRAGADRGLLAAAQDSVAAGDKLAANGDHAGAAAAYGKGLKVAADTVVFDIARFEQNLRGFFDNQTTGYSYAIVRKGQLYSAKGAGKATNQYGQGADREVNIASMTKTITAAAVLKLMEKNKLDLDESVAPFLPQQWDLHPSIEDLTFRDLMTQRSGLNGNVNPGTKLDAMRAAFENGIDPADKLTYAYQNANLAIFRVIIPGLLGVDIYGDPDTAPDVLAARTYVNYLQTQIFDDHPLGRLPDCKPTEDPEFLGIVTARAFAFPDDGTAGRDVGDWTLSCGGGGLYMSAEGVARFMARLRHTDEILNPLWRERMNAGWLGYMDPADGYTFNNGAFGAYRSHGGDLNYGARGVDTCGVNFPIAVQATVLINSRGGAYPYQCGALNQAFDAAWVKK